MKAAVYREYGPPGVIRVEEIPKPEPRDHQILVRVRAATVGTWDAEARSFSFPLWFGLPLRLVMGVRRPRWPVLGQELAGEIEAVGRAVTDFSPGDRVMAATGLGFGAHAEYACLSGRGAVARMPENLGFAEAAGIPTGGDNALHFLGLARVGAGESVVVNGAGGNIGVMAVQIAKHLGAEVTAVDAGDKLEALRALGADHVIDYTAEDYTRAGRRWDVIFDLVHESAYGAAIEALAPNGRYIIANPRFSALLRAPWTRRTRDVRVLTRFAAGKRADLLVLAELARAGAIRAPVDRTYPLERAAEAHAYVDSGRRTGTVVLTFDEAPDGASPVGDGRGPNGSPRTKEGPR